MKKAKVQEELNKMDVYTLKRWGALLDGLDLIHAKSNELGVSVEIQRHHLVRYIDEITEKTRVV